MTLRVLVAAAAALLALPAAAQGASSHSVTVTLGEYRVLQVSGTPVDLTFTAPSIDGTTGALTGVDASGNIAATAASSYVIATNASASKISVYHDIQNDDATVSDRTLSSGGITLSVQIDNPNYDASVTGSLETTSFIAIGTDATAGVGDTTLLSGISAVRETGLDISYKAETPAESAPGSYSGTVYYTLTAP